MSVRKEIITSEVAKIIKTYDPNEFAFNIKWVDTTACAEKICGYLSEQTRSTTHILAAKIVEHLSCEFGQACTDKYQADVTNTINMMIRKHLELRQ